MRFIDAKCFSVVQIGCRTIRFPEQWRNEHVTYFSVEEIWLGDTKI